MMQYELEQVSRRLIDKMSDPVDELGTFIQSLSISNKLAVEEQVAQRINEQRQQWQEALFENWHTSKQTQSLIPLIRFLCQILATPDHSFDHILPMMSGIRILQTIFDGEDGELYRKMLYDSLRGEYLKKRKCRHRKKHRKRPPRGSNFMENMILHHQLEHLLI